ncbi:hypothetical protein F5B22DRAFT_637238 [Xylaria bambusicola]|uniref:uncharacterized protein n=1 Tax=Xylaria bambusicola TaxID=326684 RepID=UPI002007EDF7|nr:uncharacterized protein F5B22DRAFT_637238 [Xylaria bambusicola]KAI0513297.1 hypothetical protein F5B22DRAFT_637238 [Xylaria bambusicola]
MEVTNPRRILAVSSADSAQHLSRVLKDLTGTTPEQTSTSLAGASHNLSLKTTYYTAEVPIWLDLIASPSEWSASFLSAEAKEVLEVLGGVMVVFALPVHATSDEGKASQDLIKQVGKVVKEGLGGWEWDGVGLCLGVGEIDDVDVWDDCCAESGLEFVQVRSQTTPTRNEYGEKTGIPRALEALEANDWANASADDLGSDFDDIDAEIEAHKNRQEASEDPNAPDLDPESLDFGFDREDFEGLRRAIWSSGKEDGESSIDGEKKAPDDAEDPIDDEDVQKMERLMAKLQAVRDSNAGLPEDQRKRAAAKAVAEVMKEI